MANTRIKNNQVTDATILANVKVVPGSITGILLSDPFLYSGNLTINGNLTVQGTTSTIDTVNTLIADPVMVLSRGETGTPSNDSGFLVKRGTSNNAAWLWDEANDQFVGILTTANGDVGGTITATSFANLKVSTALATVANIGNISISANGITSTNLNGNINLTPNGTGQISANGIVNATRFVSNIATGTAPFTVTSTTQVANLNAATAGTAGTVTTAAQPNITSVGTLTSLDSSGTITASRFVSNVVTGTAPFTVTSTTQVANLNAATAGTAGTVTTAAQPNITSVGTLTSLAVSGTITASSFTSNVATGTAPFTVTSTTQVANLNVATAGSATTAGTVTTAAQPNITSVGTLTSLGVSGTVTASSFTSNVATGTAPFTVTSTTQVANLNAATAGTAGTVTTAAQPNITSVGTLTGLNVNGNIAASVITSNIATGTAPFTVTSTTQVANLNAATAGTAGTVTTAAQPNITSLGNLTIANIDNVQIDANTISTTTGNLVLSPAANTNVIINNATAGRVFYSGTNKELIGTANFTFDGTNAAIAGDLAVNGGDITTTSTAATIFNANATTLNIGGAATAVTVGAATGTTNIKNALDVDGNVNMDGTDFTTTAANVNIANTGTTTLNIGGAATTLNIGATTGTTTVRNFLDVSGNIRMNGGNLVTTTSTVNIANTTSTTVNFAGAASAVAIGSSTSTVTIGNNLTVTGNLVVQGSTSIVDSTTTNIVDPIITIGGGAGGAAPTTNDSKDRGVAFQWHNGTTAKLGFFGYDSSAAAFTFIPDATNASEIISGSAGKIIAGSSDIANINIATNTISSLNTNGNINITPNGTGQVVVSSPVNATRFVSNVATGTAPFTVSSTTQVANLNAATAGTAGTVTTAAQPNITSVGTLTSLDSSGTITASRFVSNIATGTAPFTVTSTTQVANLNAATAGTVTTAAQPNITSVGTLTSLGVSGTVTASSFTSNVATGTAPFTVTSTTQVANLNAATAGSSTTAGTVTTAAQPNITSVGTLTSLGVSGTVTASSFTSNVATGTAPFTVTSTTQVANLNAATAGTAGTVTTAAQPNITSVGTLTSLGVTGAITTGSTISANGSISGTSFVSNIATGTAPFTVTSTTQVANLNAQFSGSAVSATTAGTVTTAAQPNITSLGNLTIANIDNVQIDGNSILTTNTNGNLNITLNGTGQVLSTGSITAPAFISNVATGTAPFTVSSTTQVANLNAATAGSATTAETVTTAAQPNITSLGNLTIANIDNVQINGNAISTTSGNLTLDAFNGVNSVVINSIGNNADFVVYGNISVASSPAIFVKGSTGQVGMLTSTPASGATLDINSTTSIKIPVGTTLQRPSSPVTGMLRYNTSIGLVEYYNGSVWSSTSGSFTVITYDSFTGDGSTLVFALSRSSTSAATIVAINGVVQKPGDAYSVSASTLTFTEAPAIGDSIDVRLLTTTQTVTTIESGSNRVGVTDTGTVYLTSFGTNVATFTSSATTLTQPVTAPRFISNVSTGTAPLTVTSTTQVANLNAEFSGSANTAGTVTNAAQPNITSVGTLTGLTATSAITADIGFIAKGTSGSNPRLSLRDASNTQIGVIAGVQVDGSMTIQNYNPSGSTLLNALNFPSTVNGNLTWNSSVVTTAGNIDTIIGANITNGGVGAFQLLAHGTAATSLSYGTNYAGSALKICSLYGTSSGAVSGAISSTSPAGTWKCLGSVTPPAGQQAMSIFLRIA